MPVRLERNGNQITSLQAWFEHAPPRGGESQWRDGFSAKELARAWCPEGQPPEAPAELQALLATIPDLTGLTFECGYPERRVRFDDVRGEPRNTDLALECTGLSSRVGLSIEAKSTETFGQVVGDEIMRAASQWAFDERPGKLMRIKSLSDAILPHLRPAQSPLAELRYQLLTAIAGAWAFAAEVTAPCAVLVMHEFVRPRADQRRLRQNARDLDRLVERLTRGETAHLGPGQMIGPLTVPSGETWPGVTNWYLGKCQTLLPPMVPAQ